MSQKYTYFWRAESPFSQHHPISFFIENKEFNCAEQYYMYQKAMTFNDHATANKVLNSKNPAQQKALGRKVFNFNEEIWDTKARDVVFKGNVSKFEQNKHLLQLLLATEGSTLVEASPMDRKWGVGLDASDTRILDGKKWQGTNLLGFILSHVRQHFLDKNMSYDVSSFKFAELKSTFAFWRTSSPFHPKHMSPFYVKQKKFVSLHHYLSYILADEEIKKEIEFCYDQRKLFFDSSKLTLHDFIAIGSYYKFQQNQNLSAQLLSTAGKYLIFIDPDKNLGSGEMGNNNTPSTHSNNYSGKNLIGKVLTTLRDNFLKLGSDLSIDTFIENCTLPENQQNIKINKRQASYSTDEPKTKKVKSDDINEKYKKSKKIESSNDEKYIQNKDKTKFKFDKISFKNDNKELQREAKSSDNRKDNYKKKHSRKRKHR